MNIVYLILAILFLTSIVLLLIGVIKKNKIALVASAIVFLVFVLATVVGSSTTISSASFLSDKYSFDFPEEYSVSSTGETTYSISNKGKIETTKSNTGILTVSKNDATKLEIFKASEYPVDRAAIGFSGEETPAEADAYIKDVKAQSAKEYLKVGGYDVWLYYNEGDSQAKKELKAIFDSIVVK